MAITTPLAGDTVSILVADSGLGGLSVCAELAGHLQRRREFAQVAITYFDALPWQDRGFNHLPTKAEKVGVFDKVLAGIERFDPDVILIACNTLSVLYADTSFAKTTSRRVVGIVDFGVELMRHCLLAEPDSQAIVFGTPTTVESAVHLSRLAGHGIGADRIVGQPCDGLAREIERDPASSAVTAMLESYVGQAVSRLVRPRGPLFSALCCTHYGYSETLFARVLRSQHDGAVHVLNPNSAMAACIVGDACRDRRPATRVTVDVVAKVRLGDDAVASISRALDRLSPATAEALRHYRRDPSLFA